MKSFITWLGSLVPLTAEIHELLGINLNFLCLCILQAIFSYLECSRKQTILDTLHTMAVLAPNRAAWTHWLAPLPPKPIKNLCPCIVSPALGSRGAWLTEKHMGLDCKRKFTFNCTSVVIFYSHILNNFCVTQKNIIWKKCLIIIIIIFLSIYWKMAFIIWTKTVEIWFTISSFELHWYKESHTGFWVNCTLST